MSLPIDHLQLPKPGDTFGGKYRLECILGSGGMGVVFGATHLITHKRVAIKWLAGEPGTGSFSDTTQRFVREARLAGEFHHPNVVQVYDLGESDGSFYMVMEWLEGESLAGRLEHVKRLSFAETSAYLIPCMHAMQRAHDVGIIHRDIKPANIFLCTPTEDRPALSKVLDFGISKRITASADMSTFVTKTGMLVGTPHYLAPEQLRGRPVDRRTDIYGFGVLLYQTLAGELPFLADNFGDLVVEISVGTPRSLRELVPDLPVGVEQVVARAMARDPDQRYASLHELIASLDALDPTPLTAATLPQINTPSSLRPIAITASNSPAATGRRTRKLLAVAAVTGTIAAAIGYVLFQRDSSASETPSANETPSASVQPRRIPLPTEPEPEPGSPGPSIPSGMLLPSQPEASLDAGHVLPEKTAQPTLPRPKPTAQARTTAKPSTPEVNVVAPELLPPSAAPTQASQTTHSEPETEHNPLRMNIQ